MLTVTDAASAHCAHMLDDADAPDGAYVRIVVEGDDPALASGQPDEDDALLKHQDRAVLVVAKVVQAFLEGVTPDCEQSPEGPRLTLA